MNDVIVQFHSQRFVLIWIVVSVLISILGGYYIALWNLPIQESNLIITTLIFFLLSFGLSVSDFYLGWSFKRKTLDYSPPAWDFEPVQLKIADAKKLQKEYNRKYFRLVADPNYWYYFLPILLIIATITLPMYSLNIDSSIEEYIPYGFVILLGSISLISFLGSWISTSNKASKDFTLPLIREALKLAVIQSKVMGISHTRVILDKAVANGYEIYRNPRVVSRVASIEEEAYIESSAEELGSVAKILVRSYKKDEAPEIIWWWSATDRNFRKYVDDTQEGYYVKNPVPSRIIELGVKDVKLIFENAVALLVLERLRLFGSNEELSSITTSLGLDVQ